MAGKRASAFLALAARVETFTLNRAWTGLTDEEFFWEPVAGAWGVRRRDACRTATPFGDGDWVADFDNDLVIATFESGDTEPMTTIGWQLWHIGSVPGRLTEIDIFGGDHTMASGWTSPYLTHHPVFPTAADAVDALRDGWSRLLGALEDADDDQLERPTPRYTYAHEPPRDGLVALGPPGPAVPAYAIVAATLNEISHHGAQVCARRDFFRWAKPREQPSTGPARAIPFA